jgi:Ca-activated chloride channel family protein
MSFSLVNLSFRYPLVLLALVVPAALLFWVWRRSDRRVVMPFDHGRPGRGLGWRLLLGVGESLPPLLLAVAVVLAAGPQKLDVPKDRRVMTNIQLCVDVSGSMTAAFGEGSRYDGAMKAVEEFCTYRKGDAFGLTFFGNEYVHWCPLTTDVSAIRCSLPFMRPEMAPPWMGGTEIGKALNACNKLLREREEGDRMIILITDGESFDLHGGNDQEIAREMRKHNITVYAIVIGMDRVQDEIQNITGLTGGDAWLAGDPDAVKTVFQRIDRMQQTKVEKVVGDLQDDFVPWCALGLSLLGLLTAMLFGLRYTPW